MTQLPEKILMMKYQKCYWTTLMRKTWQSPGMVNSGDLTEPSKISAKSDKNPKENLAILSPKAWHVHENTFGRLNQCLGQGQRLTHNKVGSGSTIFSSKQTRFCEYWTLVKKWFKLQCYQPGGQSIRWAADLSAPECSIPCKILSKKWKIGIISN